MEDNKHFKAKEGFTYKRIVDDFIMGNEMYLGKFIDDTDDVIENYVEVEDPDYGKEESTNRNSRSTRPVDALHRPDKTDVMVEETVE